MPAAMHLSRSSESAAAVMAMMGRWWPPSSRRRISVAASKPSIWGMWQSISTAS